MLVGVEVAQRDLHARQMKECLSVLLVFRLIASDFRRGARLRIEFAKKADGILTLLFRHGERPLGLAQHN